MRRMFATVCALTAAAIGLQPAAAAPEAGHYLFAWSGDPSGKGKDFIAVIDADPASETYGKLISSVASDIRSQQVHHTEYVMPASGMLFANDHAAGQTVIFDVRDPHHIKASPPFADLAGFSHPHSFLRLPNGNVLASFQAEGHMSHSGDMPMSGTDPGVPPNVHGGIVEIDDQGRVVRSASTADPSRADDLLMAYSLLPLPDIDRVIVMNSSMRSQDMPGHTYQIFRLSDLKLLSTNSLDPGDGRYGELNPQEARRGPDGSVYIATAGCGVERVTGIANDHPKSKLVYQFPGSFCGVPSIVSHYLVQTDQLLRAAIVLDIADPDHPVEVSRVTFDGPIRPHWTGYDEATKRLVVTGYDQGRIYMLAFDPQTGALSLDKAFRDEAGRPGFNLENRHWPHGWDGTGIPHGVVFSR